MPLPLRNGPHADNDFAVNIELGDGGLGLPRKRSEAVDDARLAKIVCAGIESRADANSNPAAFLARGGLFFLPFVPADQVLCQCQHPRIIAGILDPPLRPRSR